MKVLIGFFKVDVGLLIEYFLLLIEWLKKINEEEGNFFLDVVIKVFIFLWIEVRRILILE